MTPLAEPSLPDALEAHRLAYGEIYDLLAGLDEAGLATRSLCPDWDVRACAAHAVSIDKALTGWEPDPEQLFDFGVVGEFMTYSSLLSAREFAAEVAGVSNARLRHLESLDPEVLRAPSMTPVGPQTYGAFLQIRAFDLWVHARDIALPLEIELPDEGVHAEFALNEVHRSMGYIAGKKIGLEDGMTMTVHVTGGAARTFHVAVDGRAGLVESVADPDVTLTADTETFIMLACGRIDPQERIDAGRISWTGDTAWGERAARSLRFTM